MNELGVPHEYKLAISWTYEKVICFLPMCDGFTKLVKEERFVIKMFFLYIDDVALFANTLGDTRTYDGHWKNFACIRYSFSVSNCKIEIKFMKN